ncbi:hypothetical protein [Sagittula salina]|uniref:Uncharacterized protein n=1 Tax=Sagittula salina TaxID=2820268 RepID=A0A940MU12_9RHOB|nr:hypothetical protein [Sagittula salina]MBP0483942.1 hypothetical protein [Sagittula salina]
MTAKKTTPAPPRAARKLPQSGGSFTVTDKGALEQTGKPTKAPARPAPATEKEA